MKSRLAVIMVADVVGYSRMMAEDEEARLVVLSAADGTTLQELPWPESRGQREYRWSPDGPQS